MNCGAQKFMISGTKSNRMSVTSVVVPQGLILSPKLLFILSNGLYDEMFSAGLWLIPFFSTSSDWNNGLTRTSQSLAGNLPTPALEEK